MCAARCPWLGPGVRGHVMGPVTEATCLRARDRVRARQGSSGARQGGAEGSGRGFSVRGALWGSPVVLCRAGGARGSPRGALPCVLFRQGGSCITARHGGRRSPSWAGLCPGERSSGGGTSRRDVRMLGRSPWIGPVEPFQAPPESLGAKRSPVGREGLVGLWRGSKGARYPGSAGAGSSCGVTEVRRARTRRTRMRTRK